MLTSARETHFGSRPVLVPRLRWRILGCPSTLALWTTSFFCLYLSPVTNTTTSIPMTFGLKRRCGGSAFGPDTIWGAPWLARGRADDDDASDMSGTQLGVG